MGFHTLGTAGIVSWAGGYFSAMSFVGCLLGWLAGLKPRKEDC